MPTQQRLLGEQRSNKIIREHRLLLHPLHLSPLGSLYPDIDFYLNFDVVSFSRAMRAGEAKLHAGVSEVFLRRWAPRWKVARLRAGPLCSIVDAICVGLINF